MAIIGAFGALALFASGCEDTHVRIDRLPIDVISLEYPEPVIESAGDSVFVRALVGYDNCELETASVELRGDSLIVQGTALCRSTVRLNKVLTPPASPNPESFRLPFPEVAPGTYVLVAGALADTLTVAPSTLPPQTARLAALGHIYAADSCAVFASNAFQLEYELTDMPPPRVGNSVRLYATHAGPPTCDPTRVASLRTRRLELTP